MRILSKKSVAAKLDVSTRTVERMVEAGEFPQPTHTLASGQPRWFEPVVDNWILINRASSEKPDAQTATNRDKPRQMPATPKAT